MEVVLDLDQPLIDKVSDEKVGAVLVSKFTPIFSMIGKRRKQVRKTGISYDAPSVNLYDQARDLYCLGYFFSAVVVCRSTAEYLAFEIFYEEVELQGDPSTIQSIAENLDFRKIVNEFLYNPSKGHKLIDKETCSLFNELYDLGNRWVHPKKVDRKIKIEEEAYKALDKLGSLLDSLRNVMRDYEISEGKLIKKPTARKKVRPVILKLQDKIIIL